MAASWVPTTVSRPTVRNTSGECRVSTGALIAIIWAPNVFIGLLETLRNSHIFIFMVQHVTADILFKHNPPGLL